MADFYARHYVAVADAISGTLPRFEDGGACQFGAEVLADSLIALFQEDNPRFREDMFRKAAGLQEPTPAEVE